jgi:hypothetical protein
MPLQDYDPSTYKSPDPFVRLGFKRGRDLTPEVVHAAYQARMEWWHAMTQNPGYRDQVAAAKNALQEAKNILSDPGRAAEADAQSHAEGKHNILLLGGPGAGKSAILGAIYDACRAHDTPLEPLDVRMASNSRQNVLTNLQRLKSFCNPDYPRKSRQLSREPNIPNTYTPYAMVVRHRAKDKLQLTFVDTSGEDLARAMNSNSALIENIRTCHAAILIVDALAMQHQDNLQHNWALDTKARRNMPENVEAVVQEWLREEPEAPRLFCIVPVKIETRIYDPRTGREIAGAKSKLIHDVFHLFENTISCLEQQGNCVIVITPIETCGCLTLADDWTDKFSSSSAYPAEEWDFIPDRRRLPEFKRYTPAACELPLTFILNFFLTLAEAASSETETPSFSAATFQIPPNVMGFLENFLPKALLQQAFDALDRFKYAVDFVTELLGWADEDTRKAIRQVMKKSMRFDGSVQIYGNRDLLTLN